ncbi:YggU family protein, partial [Candidatus Woesearchaeota archaeon]|nr:YggU family protein [Candidatus Woesearchaeota archaeon]
KLVQEADNFTMYVKSPPVDGKANAELIKFFRKKFGVAVAIVRGKTSRRKILRIK